MPALPRVSGSAVKAFTRGGWRVVRTHGSHVMMEKPGHDAILSIPQHPELRRGTLRALIKAAGMSVQGFTDQL